MDSYRIKRKNAIPLSSAIREFIEGSRLRPGLNTHRIFEAWDAVSGAGPFTIRKFYRSGKLYVTFRSSVISSQLYPRRELLVEKINEYLSRDELFSPEDASVSWVKEIVFK